MVRLMLLCTASLAGCASPQQFRQQYWVQPGKNLQQTAADLRDCRSDTSENAQRIYTKAELEQPCMVAKGYALSSRPPQP